MPSRPATEVTVTVNGAPNPALRALTVHRSTGGGTRDNATIEIDLSARGTGQEWITNFAMNGGAGAAVQVTAFPGGAPQLIHSGVAVLPRIEIAGDREKLSFVSRVEPWMFGAPLAGVLVWDPLSGQLVTVFEDCVFNPEIDDAVLPNQSTELRLLGITPVMLDPESVRTPEAIAVQGDAPSFWTLQTAIAYLCWSLNEAQAYVQNPLGFALIPEAPLSNCRLERGKFLSDYLDDLLPRYGLTWGLDYSADVPRIAFFVRGLGTLNSVQLGLPGSTYAGDNAVETAIDFDVGSAVNQVICYGDWLHVESTFVLSRGWNAALDATDEKDLAKDGALYNDPGLGYREVWRKWVLNEAGDYVGLRPELRAPFDLSTLFNSPTPPRRRAFLPTITLGGDGAPYGAVDGVHVEFSTDGGATWKTIASLEDRTCVILERECGVLFDGFFPPAELIRAGAAALVRATATVRADLRLGTVVGPDASSPLAALSPVLIDGSKSFHWRVVAATSVFAAKIATGALEADAADDTLDLEAYADWLQETFDLADCSGRCVVEGLDTIGSGGVYDLGQLITGVNGRAISLNAQSASSGEIRFPQIVAIDYDCQRQRRTLLLETYRDAGHASREASGGTP